MVKVEHLRRENSIFSVGPQPRGHQMLMRVNLFFFFFSICTSVLLMIHFAYRSCAFVRTWRYRNAICLRVVCRTFHGLCVCVCVCVVLGTPVRHARTDDRSKCCLNGRLTLVGGLKVHVGLKVAHTRLPSVGFQRWSWFFAVSLQVTWVINPAVGCHYFSAGLQLPSQSLRELLPILLLGEQRHDGCEQFT